MRTLALGLALLVTAAGCAEATSQASSETTVRSGSGSRTKDGKRRGRHNPRYTTTGELNVMSSSDSSARANENARDRLEKEWLQSQGREPDEIFIDRSLDSFPMGPSDADRNDRERDEPLPPCPRPNADDPFDRNQ